MQTELARQVSVQVVSMDTPDTSEERVVPVQSVRRWATCCSRWLNDKRQSVGCAVYRGAEAEISRWVQSHTPAMDTTEPEAPCTLGTHKSRAPIQSPAINLQVKNTDLML